MNTHEQDLAKPTPTSKVVMVAGPFGSGMEELAAMLAEKLQVPLYDPHRLEELASDREFHDTAWSHLKEGVGSFFDYWLSHLHEKPGMSRAEHLYYLKETLRNVTVNGAVLVGMCPHYIFPDEHLFRIHVDAGAHYCARRLADARECDHQEALMVFYNMEDERVRFLHDLFEHAFDQPISYDLVLNAETMSPQLMLEECLAAMESKHFLEKAA